MSQSYNKYIYNKELLTKLEEYEHGDGVPIQDSFIEPDANIFYKDLANLKSQIINTDNDNFYTYKREAKFYDPKFPISDKIAKEIDLMAKISNQNEILKKLLTKIHSALELKENCSLEYSNGVDKQLIKEIEQAFEKL